MNNKGRVSLIELVAIIIIAIEVLFLIGSGLGWIDFHVSSGNDSGYLNTCESEAKINSLNGTQCPVNDCPNSSGDCEHYINGSYIGYFDSVTNTIVGEKPKGYNSSKNPEVDGKTYAGKAGTMVIEVIVKDGSITYEWTGGKS
jgi:hypothetical protein